MTTAVADFGAPGEDFAAHWAALIGHATPNVFLHPAALGAAQATRFAPVHVLRAWLGGAHGQLIGVWALQRSLLTPLGPSFLATPPYEYSFVSNPVVDLDHMEEAMGAFLDLIASDRRLPGVLRLRYLDADCPSYGAIVGALAARGARWVEVSRRPRPFATRASPNLGDTTRRKLRQKGNRLGAVGAVVVQNDRSTDGVRHAFETYLALEAASWKGQHGTALLCDESDANFTRRMITELAAEGSASVALLTLDGRAIAAQVLLYCGARAYTWKTAFDAAFGRFSPGAMLIERLTEQLFAIGAIQAIESCSPEGGFMNRMWHGRRATVDLLADLGSSRSLEFSAVAVGARSYAQLRAIRDTLRASSRPFREARNEHGG